LLTYAHVDQIHDLHLSSLLFPLPFCLCSFHIFFLFISSSLLLCAYLSPSIFCLSSSPSAKPISSRTLRHIHVYIPFRPSGLPSTPSSATFLVIKFSASSRSDNSYFHFPSFHSHSTTLPPRPHPWLLKTNGYILVTFCFLIRTQHLVTILHPLMERHVYLLAWSSHLHFPFRSCSLRSAL
jgi:hypothetical protein